MSSASAWGKLATPENINLQDVFSEDLAQKLHAREQNHSPLHQNPHNVEEKEAQPTETEISVQNVPEYIGEIPSSLWDHFESEMKDFDPRPNFVRFVPHGHNSLIRFDFEAPGIPSLLDNYSRVLLFKFLRSQVLKEVNGIMFVGKEALLLHGLTGTGEKCVIKIFKKPYTSDNKVELNEAEERKACQFCAHQEMINLEKLNDLGIPCPRVIHYRKHILVTSFIGDDVSAQTLGEAQLTLEEYKSAYRQVVHCMTESYKQNNICHGDLSENNILWYQNKCYFIDLSQSVTPLDPNAFHFLMKGAKNIHKFFESKGVPDLIKPEVQFRNLVGLDYKDRVALWDIHKSFWARQKEESN